MSDVKHHVNTKT